MYGNVSSRTLSDRRDDYLYRTERSDGCKSSDRFITGTWVEMFRFKTGTRQELTNGRLIFPRWKSRGRRKSRSVFFHDKSQRCRIDQVSCWLTYTNEKTHEIIRNNHGSVPIYAGIIEGTGPRYCPSIEDKVVKFADKDRHQIFIEPEGLHTNEMYVGGMSSSLPEDVQHEMYHSAGT